MIFLNLFTFEKPALKIVMADYCNYFRNKIYVTN
jgi:hypothetical protein